MMRDAVRRPVQAWLAAAALSILLVPVQAAATQKERDLQGRSAKSGSVTPPKDKSTTARHGQIALRHVDSWGYQLQNVRPRLVTRDGLDLLVVDYSRDGTESGALSRADVDLLRKRAREPDRIVIAYLSIGEAEDYRYYWSAGWSEKPKYYEARRQGYAGAADGLSVGVPDQKAPLAKLTASAPAWLADENPAWRGNYLVRYWDAEWQAIIFGSATAYLDKIIAAGFDGVYLDKIDSNDDWQKTRPGAEREMVELVKRLAAYARGKRPGFIIVPQNGEDLLKYPDYVAAIDAIAKEDLLYGGGTRKDGEANPEKEILSSKKLLDRARRAQRPVLTVEYLEEIESILDARKRMRAYDYVPFFARRALGETPLFPPARSAVEEGEKANGKAQD